MSGNLLEMGQGGDWLLESVLMLFLPIAPLFFQCRKDELLDGIHLLESDPSLPYSLKMCTTKICSSSMSVKLILNSGSELIKFK